MQPIDELISSYSYTIVACAIVLLFGLTLFSLYLKNQTEDIKRLLFGSFLIATILPTLFLIGSTVYLNTISSSKGPVHWHADFEIWACGKEVNLRDPKGLSNKIGTATLHEHNDNKIHMEGVVIKREDASLNNFFKVIGGSLTNDTLVVPVNEGKMVIQSGISCGDGIERELQFFVYKTEGDYYRQTKLENPGEYIMSPFSNVPPADCIIAELDTPKGRTDKLCQSYEVALELDKLKGEVQ